MLIIISLKKLSTTERLTIRKQYSLIEYNDNNHKYKDISSLGNAELLWFSLIPSITGSINNNVFKYLLNHIKQLIKPQVVIVYNNEKYKKLLKDLLKIANFVIPNFPQLKTKNLHEILKQDITEKESKNLLLETSEEEEEENTDVDFTELNEILHSLQNKYNRLKSIHVKEKEKKEKLKKLNSSFNIEIKKLKEEVKELKHELKEKTLLQKPELKREITSKKTEDVITIVDENNTLKVKSSLSGLLSSHKYSTRRQKKRILQQLKKEYQKN